MPTSRTLNRATILPKTNAPRRVMHWRQQPAPPHVPLANRPVRLAGEVAEEVAVEIVAPVPVHQAGPILVQIQQDHGKIRYEGKFFAQLIAFVLMLAGWWAAAMLFVFENMLAGLALFIFSAWAAQRVRPHHYCSLCRGIVQRKAKKCQHCGCKF